MAFISKMYQLTILRRIGVEIVKDLTNLIWLGNIIWKARNARGSSHVSWCLVYCFIPEANERTQATAIYPVTRAIKFVTTLVSCLNHVTWHVTGWILHYINIVDICVGTVNGYLFVNLICLRLFLHAPLEERVNMQQLRSLSRCLAREAYELFKSYVNIKLWSQKSSSCVDPAPSRKHASRLLNTRACRT